MVANAYGLVRHTRSQRVEKRFIFKMYYAHCFWHAVGVSMLLRLWLLLCASLTCMVLAFASGDLLERYREYTVNFEFPNPPEISPPILGTTPARCRVAYKSTVSTMQQTRELVEHLIQSQGALCCMNVG